VAQLILIVDDNPDDIELTRIVLTEMGRKERLKFAPSGDVALQLLRREDDLPSLIFLDLKTPGMGGIETLRQIRSDERLRHIPVIIVTSSSFPQDEKEALEAGADSYLYKAFDIDKFGRDINSLLQRFLKC